MSRTAFLALTGPTLLHATAGDNVAMIRRHGLMSAAALARRAGLDPAGLALRDTRRQLSIGGHAVTLNHQRPLRAGRARAHDFLVGYSLRSWARQLDERVFLWPSRANEAFRSSLPAGAVLLEIDAGQLYDRLGAEIWLSPINSGNATRRPARRGDWLYVNARDAAEFATNRMQHGAATRRDRLREVSITCPIPPDILRQRDL